MFSTLFIDLRLVVSIQTNHMCHVPSTQLRDYFFTYKFFSLLSPCWFFICWGKCHKPPRYVSYKCTYVLYDGTFGTSDQGQMLDVWQGEDSQIHHLIWQIPRFTISSIRKKSNQKRYRQIRISTMILDHMDRNKRYFPSNANLVRRYGFFLALGIVPTPTFWHCWHCITHDSLHAH